MLRTCSILPGSVTANPECNQLSNSNTYNTGAIFQTCPNKVRAELAVCLDLLLQKRNVGKISRKFEVQASPRFQFCLSFK